MKYMGSAAKNHKYFGFWGPLETCSKRSNAMNVETDWHMYTHGHNIPQSWFSEKHFNSFDSLPIGIKKQMMSHLKALVKSFENQE